MDPNTWPPTLAEAKADREVSERAGMSTRDDAALQSALDAAVEYVQAARKDLNYSRGAVGEDLLPFPGVLVKLGTIRLAARYFYRRTNVEGVVSLGEAGSARLPSFDADIERMLRIGRFRRPVTA